MKSIEELAIRVTGPCRTLSRFFENDDEYRRDRFKFEARFRDFFNSALKKSIDMLGGERPVIIGRKLTTNFYKRDNCFEICMDVGSSSTASMLYSLVMKTSGSMVMDYCFFIEGKQPSEIMNIIIDYRFMKGKKKTNFQNEF